MNYINKQKILKYKKHYKNKKDQGKSGLMYKQAEDKKLT